MGPWFLELRQHINATLSGVSPVKYFHNFAHDGSISPVLGVLQIDRMPCASCARVVKADRNTGPGMGSETIFEIWRAAASSQDYIRVLWGGQAIKTSTPLGTLDMIPLSSFEAYLDSVIPSDLVAACNSS